MALVACKECKKEVASSAKKCPHCGVANPSMGVKETLTGLVVLGVAVAVAMTMCSDKKSEPAGMAMPSVAAQVPPAQELPRQEQEWLTLYRNSSEEVRAALKAAGNELTKPAKTRGKAA